MRNLKTKSDRIIEGEHELGESKPCGVSISSLLHGADEFAAEHLSGLISFDISGLSECGGKLFIDVKYFAELIRELLRLVGGREIITVRTERDGCDAVFKISFCDIESLDAPKVQRIKRLAVLCGFEISIDREIVLRSKITFFDFSLFYALTAHDIRNTLEKVMFS